MKYTTAQTMIVTNRLAGETSPYLLQHAKNPVDWYAWGSEALGLARARDMPIFLSIGYSACHWCHVMAHESFENEEIAALLNEHFVSIKVDREERPDIDDVYQKVCMSVTGQGGWPLSAFLTPDQRPFYVGTYYPPRDMHGRPGFGSIVRRMSQAWNEQRGAVEEGAAKFMRGLEARASSDTELRRPADIIEYAASALMSIADATNGGFGHAPKFPNASCVSFLLRHSMQSAGKSSGSHALRTLRKMSAGGMFDHVGGGFHRYSTDARWQVPHFEKMGYDNALLPTTYAEAYALTGDSQYRRVMERTLGFVMRDLRGSEGEFYSALDADSGGEEGAYYVWDEGEIRGILGDDADMFCLYYDVTQGGNWEGRTILRNNVPLSAVSFRYNMGEAETLQKLDACLEKLRIERSKRTSPGLDDKSITSWNAMMIAALVSAGMLTRNEAYMNAALRCADFVRRKMTARGDSSVLLRSRRGDVAGSVSGYLEDYSWYADALTDLFCAGGDATYLDYAEALAERIVDRFYDSDGGFYMTDESSHQALIMRPKSMYDLSVPSGGSVAVRALWRIGHITGNESYIDAARRAMTSREAEAAQNPFAFGSILCAIYARECGATEITLLDGGGDSGIRECLETTFVPEAILVRVDTADRLSKLRARSFFEGKAFRDGSQVAYVCRDSVCTAPITMRDDLDTVLRGRS